MVSGEAQSEAHSEAVAHAPWLGLAVTLAGQSAYHPVWQVQKRIWEMRRCFQLPDTLLLLQHEAVITIGRHGDERNVRSGDGAASGNRPEVVRVDRGGDVTYHGPGQLTAYLIADLRAHDRSVRGFVTALEEVVIATLRGFGIEGCRRAGLTGVWARAGDRWAKVASLGVRIARGVSYHGIALNVMDCSDGFRWIVPCGLAGESVTSMESLGESRPRVEEVADAVREQFGLHLGITWRKVAFGAITSAADGGALIEQLEVQALRGARKPEWLRVKLPGGARFAQVREVLGRGGLHTVCESARCPNQHECWNAGTATFLILGNHCTRDCRFCAVAGGPVAAVDPGEAEEVARAAQRLGLSHVVVTSVTRDDLPDGGAGAFVATLRRVRERLPGATVEVLIPDFAGDTEALDRVLAEQPDVLNHNIETVPRLYPVVRAGADLRRSLGILQRAAAAGLRTKSGLMVGLGEGDREILEVLRELRRTGCDRLTIGQYLQPTRAQLPVQRYATPAQFADWRRQALDLGFVRVESGPLVRSSYRAAQGLL